MQFANVIYNGGFFMKKLLILVCALALTFNAFAVITGSAHDFQASAWNTTGEICIVCHTPHGADTTITDAPLWNHENTTATFTLYSSSSLDATLGQPSGISLLCLSCHDGTVALENFGGTTTGTNFIAAAYEVGPDLSGDHPISFTYNAALATTDGGLFDPTTALSGLGSTITNDLLFSNQMECSSCHDVHNEYNQASLLVKSNAASALCLTCHDK